ncbi:unnamed protein product [Chrysoparadoxa australica]
MPSSSTDDIMQGVTEMVAELEVGLEYGPEMESAPPLDSDLESLVSDLHLESPKDDVFMEQLQVLMERMKTGDRHVREMFESMMEKVSDLDVGKGEEGDEKGADAQNGARLPEAADAEAKDEAGEGETKAETIPSGRPSAFHPSTALDEEQDEPSNDKAAALSVFDELSVMNGRKDGRVYSSDFHVLLSGLLGADMANMIDDAASSAAEDRLLGGLTIGRGEFCEWYMNWKAGQRRQAEEARPEQSQQDTSKATAKATVPLPDGPPVAELSGSFSLGAAERLRGKEKSQSRRRARAAAPAATAAAAAASATATATATAAGPGKEPAKAWMPPPTPPFAIPMQAPAGPAPFSFGSGTFVFSTGSSNSVRERKEQKEPPNEGCSFSLGTADGAAGSSSGGGGAGGRRGKKGRRGQGRAPAASGASGPGLPMDDSDVHMTPASVPAAYAVPLQQTPAPYAFGVTPAAPASSAPSAVPGSAASSPVFEFTARKLSSGDHIAEDEDMSVGSTSSNGAGFHPSVSFESSSHASGFSMGSPETAPATRHQRHSARRSKHSKVLKSLKELETVKKHKNLAKELYRVSKYSQARSEYSCAIAIAKSARLPNQLCVLYWNRAAALMMEGHYQEAALDCRAAAAEDSTFTKALTRQARALLKAGRLAEAQEVVSNALAASHGQQEGRAELREECVKARRDIMSVRCALDNARFRMSRSQHGEASRECKAALELSPALEVAHMLWAQAQLQMKRYAEVVDGSEAAARTMAKSEESSGDPSARPPICSMGESLALYYCKALRYAGRAVDFEQALNSVNGKWPWVQQLMEKYRSVQAKKHKADRAYSQGNFRAAANAYTQALKVDKEDVEMMAKLYCNRAAAYMSLQDYHAAVEDCDAALRLKPSYHKAHLRLARCYKALQLWDDALEVIVGHSQWWILRLLSDFSCSNRSASKCVAVELPDKNSSTVIQEYEPYLSSIGAGGSDRAAVEMERDFCLRMKEEEEERRHQRYNRAGSSYYNFYEQEEEDDEDGYYYDFDGDFFSQFRPGGRGGGGRRSSGNSGQKVAARDAPKCHYTTMSISETATAVQIKKAYHRLALKHHPDKCQHPDAAERFKEIKDAYEVLGDSKARKAYDASRRQRAYC